MLPSSLAKKINGKLKENNIKKKMYRLAASQLFRYFTVNNELFFKKKLSF
jgi:hypothetical protein